MPWLWGLPPERPPLLPALRRVRGARRAVLHPGRPHRAAAPVRDRAGRSPTSTRSRSTSPSSSIVGGHIGYPWTEEMVALARKYPNVYIDTSAYTPRRYPPELVEYLRARRPEEGHVRHQLPDDRARRGARGLDGLGLDDEARELFLDGNARRVFDLRPPAAKDRRRMLSITSKSPYALRALTELARAGDAGPVPIGELARRRDIPVQFLEQLFAVLRRAGVLRSQRGVKGGYSFAREPSEITVLEVVELLDASSARAASRSSPRPPRPPARCSPTPPSPTSSNARTATRARRCTTSSCAPAAVDRAAATVALGDEAAVREHLDVVGARARRSP